MFLAVRDLWWARGRFALMVAAVGLITALVVMLSGLTEGLARQSISAVTSLSTDRIVFEKPAAGQELSMNAGRVTDAQVAAARRQPGVRSADPLRIGNSRATVDGVVVQVALFGIDPSAPAAPKGLTDGSTVISRELAHDRGIGAGDEITVAGSKLRVAATVDEASFSHLPVLWVTPSVGRQDPSDGVGSVILMNVGSSFEATGFESSTGLLAKTKDDALGAIGSYSAENGSLTMIRGLLIAISALVIGAFFTVWTVQREPDLAVLKAIGARTSYLVRDALGQALLTLLIGGVLGAAASVAAGLAVGGRVPIVIEARTVVQPFVLLVAVGLIGAVAALRRVVTVDPMAALGGAR